MNPSKTRAELEKITPETDEIIKSIGIPARPITLVNLQREIASDDPDRHRAAALVASDVTLSVAVLRTVNSPAYGLSRRCETTDQAIAMIGFKRLGVIVTGLMMRNLIRGDQQQLAQFWDVSSKRSFAMSQLAKGLGSVDVDVAQSFGLFCDVGIPLLLQRFADYSKTLTVCKIETERIFTQVEQDKHRTDHALVGAIMARTWDLSPTLCLAIRLHHDYEIGSSGSETVTNLIAINLIAELAIQRFCFMTSVEWNKGRDFAIDVLALSDYEVEDWIDRLSYDFAELTN